MPSEPSAGTTTIQCPQCGGESPLPTGRQLVRCPFCSGTLFVDRSAVVSHYSLPTLLDGDEAAAALRRWMAGNETVKGLDRRAQVQSLEPLTFPMWLFRARTEGGEVVFVEPAAPTPIPQVADLEVPAGKLEPFRQPDESVRSMEPTVPLETARGWVEQRGVERVTETALVDVPFWQARYEFDGRSYRALVEASTGTVLAAVYPEKAESPYVLIALLGLLLFGIEGLAISNLVVKLLAYAVTAIPLTLLAFWVARKV
jgi:hypothetical protein